MENHKKKHIFLSYAHEDDIDFTERLYEDLTRHGFGLWWDQVDMPGRGLTFLQEIRDAINESDRLLLVIGPKALTSDYVVSEWRHALNYGKLINPIMRIGDFNLIPDELKILHIEDFREDAYYEQRFKFLVTQLSEPSSPIGRLIGVPGLPSHLVKRTALLKSLKKTVMADIVRPVIISEAESKIGVHGMGGIGKSVIANMLGRDFDVRRAFSDGIVWVPFGTKPNILELLSNVIRTFDDESVFLENVYLGRLKLSEILRSKKVLLLLDDVWERKHADAFDVLGARCRAVITTRDAGLVSSLGGVYHQIQLLTMKEATELLAEASSTGPHKLPPVAKEIISECGRLPLAVALCGGMARKGISWNNILERLKQSSIEYIGDRHAKYDNHRSIWAAIKVSWDMLEPDEKKRFSELAVFNPDTVIPESAVSTLWGHTGGLNKFACEDLLISLHERSLISLDTQTQQDNGTPLRLISIHDLIYDFVTRMANDVVRLHSKILDAYRKQCPDGWANGPNDGYFFQFLVHHMIEAGRWEEVSRVLSDLFFLEAKCLATGVIELQRDFEKARIVDTKGVLNYSQSALRVIYAGLNANAHLLQQDPSLTFQQLANHLFIINKKNEKHLSHFLKRNERKSENKFWFLSVKERNSTIKPLRVINDECVHGIRGIEFSKDNILLFVLANRVLTIWDIRTGEEIAAFQETKPYNNEILTDKTKSQSNKYAEKDTLFLLRSSKNFADFNVQEKSLIKILENLNKQYDRKKKLFLSHSETVHALSPDGRFSLTCENARNKIILRNNQTRQPIAFWWANNYIFTPDSKYLLIGSFSALEGSIAVWDLKEEKAKQNILAHIHYVECLAVSSDSTLLASGDMNTVKIWDIISDFMPLTKRKKYLEYTLHRLTAGCISYRLNLCATGQRKSCDVQIWDAQTMDGVIELEPGCYDEEHSQVEDVNFSPQGDFLAVITDDYLTVYKTENWERLWENDFLSSCSILYSPDGSILATIKDGKIQFWEVISGILKYTIDIKQKKDIPHTFSITGSYFAFVESDGFLRVWDTLNWKELVHLKTKVGRVTSINVFKPHGKLITLNGKTMRVYDFDSMQKINPPLHGIPFNNIQWAGYKKNWAISLSVNIVILWDIDNGKVLAKYPCQSGILALDVDTEKGLLWVLDQGSSGIGPDVHTLKIWNGSSSMISIIK